MPTYSFGEESPLKFEISDKLAKRYNEAIDQYFKAQVRFNQKFGRKWDPSNDPIEMKWSSKQKKAWNQFARIFDYKLKTEGPYMANDIMDDYLIKNTVSALAVGGIVWGRGVTLAVGLGTLYGLLRGLERHHRA